MVTQGCVSHLLTLLEQLVLHRTVAFYCPYKVLNSVVTICLPHVLLNTTSADREAGYFLPLVHLHIEKQCPAQNIIHKSSLHLYQPTEMSKIQGRKRCLCRVWVSCTLYYCTSYLSQEAFGQVNSRCVLMYCHLKPGL